jgi:hypothetical protein
VLFKPLAPGALREVVAGLLGPPVAKEEPEPA